MLATQLDAFINLAKENSSTELYSKALEIKISALELQQLYEEACKHLEVIEKERGKDLVFKNNAYFKDGDIRPYCSACWDKDKKQVHLVRKHGMMYSCPVCLNKDIPIRIT